MKTPYLKIPPEGEKSSGKTKKAGNRRRERAERKEREWMLGLGPSFKFSGK